VDPVPDPLLLRKSDSAGNRTRDLWICSQELWPLDHRGGLWIDQETKKTAKAHKDCRAIEEEEEEEEEEELV
jgi:hypothetical protein